MNIYTAPTSTDGQVQGLEPQLRSGPINILIVDDEPKNLTVLETILDNPNYRLVRAETANQALLALVDNEFALLILDIQMPDMTGFELAQMIKQRKKTAMVPIIFLTAYYSEDQHVLEGYGSGAVDYLHKPINPAILRSKVAVFADLHNKNRILLAEVIERRRAEEQLREVNETLEQRVTERTEALRLSETRYRDLVHALPAAVYATDEQGRITLYNQAAVALWGRDPKAGKDLWCGSWKIYRPDGSPLPLDQCPMAVTLREGRAVRGEEIVIERPDGTRRHVLPHPEPMRNADGEVIGAINMLVDITDRKEAEKAVAHLAAIVTSSDDAIIGKDLHGIVTSWNQGAERLFGYAPEEMIGQPVLRLIPPERHDEESHILGQITQGKPITHYETIRLCKDGNELTVSLTVSPVLSDGKIIGASTIIRDVSEQKRVEHALRRSERNLSDFFDNASVGLHWVGPDGLIIKANQTELDLLGYSREEYLGHHIAEFHVDQTAIQYILRCLISGDTLREYPARIRCKDGSVLDVLINSNALFEDSKFIHSRCFTRDITERKRAETDLRESEERLRMAQQAGKIGAFEWNMKTGVNTWTKELEVMYGLPPGGFPGTQGAWETLVHSEDRPLALERVKYSIDTGEPGEAEFRIVWPDGSTHWVAGRWQIFSDETGSPLCLTGVNIDITARKQTEAALREHDRILTSVNGALKTQALALADANKELEKFSYSVSHDLRAPLRTIDAFSRILEEDHGPHMNESARRSLSIIRKAVGQAGELIDDLLGFSKLGRQGMTVRMVNMADLAREVANELRLHEDRRVDLAIGDLPACQGDPRFLKLVWVNLLTNALKYSKNRIESRIEIGWMPDDASSEMVIYYVKDNGIGFDMKYAHKLFGVFQRLHRQEDFEGTGVGLAVVQRIVQRHDGRVWAEGKVDGGATFFVSLRKATT